MNALPNRSHQTLSQLTTSLRRSGENTAIWEHRALPLQFLQADEQQTPTFDIKLLTHAGRHIEAQALYEELINRTSSDGGRSGQLIHEN